MAKTRKLHEGNSQHSGHAEKEKAKRRWERKKRAKLRKR